MEETTTSTRSSKIFWITICAIMILGAGLRMYGLTRQSLWLDEANGVRIAEKSFKEMVSELQKDVSPPLHYFVLHTWIKTFGSGELSVRSLAALFGILLIPVICYIGSSLFNRSVGFISAFMASISQFHIAYSQEVRMYSMLALLGLLSMFFLYKAVTTNVRTSWMAYVVCTVLTIYTHNYGLFIAASGVVFFVICATTQKAKWRIFLITQGIIAVCYVPWLPTLIMRHFQSGAIVGWIPQMRAYHVYQTFKTYSGLVFNLFNPVFNKLIIAMGLVAFFCFFIAGIFSVRKHRRLLVPYVENSTSLLLLLCYLFVALAIPMIISLKKPIFIADRYSIAAWPAFVLIVGVGISKVKKLYRLLPVIALMLFVSSVSLYWHYFVYVKSCDRTIAALIESRASNDDLIVFAPDYLEYSIDYYLRTPLKHLGYPWPSRREAFQDTEAGNLPRKPGAMTRLIELKLGNSAGKVFLVSSESATHIDGIRVIRKLFDESYKKIENVKYTSARGATDVAIYRQSEELRRGRPIKSEQSQE
jgi:mannosyltransferase